MNSFFKELSGGIAVMVVASAVGIGVNAVRPHGLPLIQHGEAVSTVQHGQADSTAAETPAPGAISLEEMKRLFDSHGATIIDARSTDEYAEGHIPGAINIPHDRIPEFQDVLNREVANTDHIVCYCRGPECDFADLLATELKIIGYADVSVFSGGWEKWSGANYPVEKGPQN